MKLIYIFGGSILFIFLILGLVVFDRRNQSALQELRQLSITPTSTASYQQGIEAGKIAGQQELVALITALYERKRCVKEADYPACVAITVQTPQGVMIFYPDYVK